MADVLSDKEAFLTTKDVEIRHHNDNSRHSTTIKTKDIHHNKKEQQKERVKQTSNGTSPRNGTVSNDHHHKNSAIRSAQSHKMKNPNKKGNLNSLGARSTTMIGKTTHTSKNPKSKSPLTMNKSKTTLGTVYPWHNMMELPKPIFKKEYSILLDNHSINSNSREGSESGSVFSDSIEPRQKPHKNKPGIAKVTSFKLRDEDEEE
ncbi:unnamed protein product, partial [Owenia fusiformis]